MCRWPVHIKTDLGRTEALKLLDAEGTLLVMCSLVDNMPYVLAEAAVSHPLVTLASLIQSSCPASCSLCCLALLLDL